MIRYSMSYSKATITNTSLYRAKLNEHVRSWAQCKRRSFYRKTLFLLKPKNEKMVIAHIIFLLQSGALRKPKGADCQP